MNDSNVSDEAFKNLQQNYEDLLSKHARALIAVDQLRVAKYLARPRTFDEKAIGTQMQTQTDNSEADKAVTELETQIDECIPLFAANEDPVGDLQQLLQGLQSDLAECLRNSDQNSAVLQNRVSDCEDKIRNMEGALTLKILDSNSRTNSRANSRCNSHASNRRSGALSRSSGASSHDYTRAHSGASSQYTRGTLPNTSSILSGLANTDNTVNSYPNFDRLSSHYATSDFEQEEQLCNLGPADSLTDIIEMHNDMRDSEHGSASPDTDSDGVPHAPSLWCIPRRRPSSRSSSRKSSKSPSSKSPQKPDNFQTNWAYKPLISPGRPGTAEKDRAAKHKKMFSKPLSIKLKIFKKAAKPKYKKCISVITDSVAGNEYELLPGQRPALSGQRPASVARSDSYRRSCSESSNLNGVMAPLKLDKLQNCRRSDNHHNSDSALGSSVTVTRNKNKNNKSTQQGVITTSRSAQGSVQGSVSNMSIASSARHMMYCTPILGPDPASSRSNTPATGYDFVPCSYPDSECGGEIEDILGNKSPDYENLSKYACTSAHNNHSTTSPQHQYNNHSTTSPQHQYNNHSTTSPQLPPPRRTPLRAKRSRLARTQDKLPGYDSGFNEDTSPKSSPHRTALHPGNHGNHGNTALHPDPAPGLHAPRSPGSPRSTTKSVHDYKTEISEVREGVQELADRLRDLKSSFNGSSRSSSPVMPPRRAQHTRDALRERLRRLQCSSPASYDPAPRRSASPRRSSSPLRDDTYSRSSSPRYRSSSPSNRGYQVPSPLMQYPRSPRSPDRDYRDSRHLFYNSNLEQGGGGAAPGPAPGCTPIEVGVRVGGPATTNYDIGPPSSPRHYPPIENFQNQSLQSLDQPYCISPTSGMETHFHFNFYGGGSPTPDYPYNTDNLPKLQLTEV